MNLVSSAAHPRSVLVGLALAGVAILALGALQPAERVQHVNSDPLPGAVVRIVEGQNYVVPQGQALTVKALGAVGGGQSAGLLKVNGVGVAQLPSLDAQGVAAFPFPVVASAGDTVTVEELYPDALTTVFAHGYLSAP